MAQHTKPHRLLADFDKATLCVRLEIRPLEPGHYRLEVFHRMTDKTLTKRIMAYQC